MENDPIFLDGHNVMLEGHDWKRDSLYRPTQPFDEVRRTPHHEWIFHPCVKISNANASKTICYNVLQRKYYYSYVFVFFLSVFSNTDFFLSSTCTCVASISSGLRKNLSYFVDQKHFAFSFFLQISKEPPFSWIFLQTIQV